MTLFYDTNAIIEMFQGDKSLSEMARSASKVYISVITVLEFYSYELLSIKDKQLFKSFCQTVSICNIMYQDNALVDSVASLRIKHKIKLPDAIILAQALLLKAKLVTNDKVLKKVNQQL